MNQIEKVARAFPALWHLVQYHKSGGHSGSGSDRTLANALRELAAIAAMQPAPQEPVVWMYSMEGREPVFLQERLRGDVLCGGRGWTETPLYAFPTPPAGGSDEQE